MSRANTVVGRWTPQNFSLFRKMHALGAVGLQAPSARWAPKKRNT